MKLRAISESGSIWSYEKDFTHLGLNGQPRAQPDPCPKCVLQATRNFRIPLGHGASIEVHQGETFTGRMCLDLVRIEINGIQYKASRNDFSLVRYLPHD